MMVTVFQLIVVCLVGIVQNSDVHEICPNIPVDEDFLLIEMLCKTHWLLQFYEQEDVFGHNNSTQCPIIHFTFDEIKMKPAYLDQIRFDRQTGKPDTAIYAMTYNSTTRELTFVHENPDASWGPIKGRIIQTDNKSYFVILLCAESKPDGTDNPTQHYLSVRVYSKCLRFPPFDFSKVQKLLREHGKKIIFKPANNAECNYYCIH